MYQLETEMIYSCIDEGRSIVSGLIEIKMLMRGCDLCKQRRRIIAGDEPIAEFVQFRDVDIIIIYKNFQN